MIQALSRRFARTLLQSSLLGALALAATAHAASWTTLKNAAPNGTGLMFLLTDGTLMVKTGNQAWSRLTPSSTGSYADGTWSALAPMGTGRLYFASHVLPDGRVWVLGGEYSGPSMNSNWTNTGEIYDPVADRWTPIPNFPEDNYGDVPTMLIDRDRILTGSLQSRNSYFYNISSNSWSSAGQKAYDDRSDEESWVRLPGGRVMTYDLFLSDSTQGAYAEAFDPVSGKWSGLSPSDGTANGTIPQLSSDALGSELGPGMLLRRSSKAGTVLFIGATGHTGLYTIDTNTWSAGPDLMGTRNGSAALFGADDAPGAEMPSGHVLIAADSGPGGTTFAGPTQLFDFDPKTFAVKVVSPAFPKPDELNGAAFTMNMLALPTGEILVSNGSTSMWIYSPDGHAPKASRPTLSKLKYTGSGKFTLTGTQLDGVSAGAAYGDDNEMDENYPIVSLKADDGNVYYARTTNWSRVSVADKHKQTVDFTLKAGTPAGHYALTVSGAGVQSLASCVSLSADEAAGAGSAANVALAACK